MKDQKAAYIYALLAVFFWSTVATAFKLTLRELDQFQMLFAASVSSCIIFLFSILIQNKTKLLFEFSFKDIFFSAFLALLNPFGYYLVLFKAYDLLKAQEAQTLNYFWAVILVLLSIPMLKQKISLKSFFAILISFSGVFVIATRGDILSFRFTDVTGVSLALGSAFIWALYWIYTSRDKKDDSVRLFLNFLFGTVYILVAVLIFSDFTDFNLKGVSGGVYIGTFEMGLTFFFWSKAVKLSETTAKISNLIFLSPFLSLIFIHLILKEDIFLSTFAGLVLIVTGILFQRKINKNTV